VEALLRQEEHIWFLGAPPSHPDISWRHLFGDFQALPALAASVLKQQHVSSCFSALPGEVGFAGFIPPKIATLRVGITFYFFLSL